MACLFLALLSGLFFGLEVSFPGLSLGLEVARMPPVGIPEPVPVTQRLVPLRSPSLERRQGFLPPAEYFLALPVSEQLALPAILMVERQFAPGLYLALFDRLFAASPYSDAADWPA